LTDMSGERQIDQFDFEVCSGFVVGNRHSIVRLGSWHAPFYDPISLSTSIMLQSGVHRQISSRAYRPRPIYS
jgi:hypothetical protein